VSASAYVTAVLADSPAAFWELQDASGDPADSSGHGHNMTAVTGPLAYLDPGPFGSDYSIRFGDLAAATQASFDFSVNNISMEAWIQIVAAGSNFKGPFGNNAPSKGWDVDLTSTRHVTVVCQGVAIEASSVAALPEPTSPAKPYLPILGVGGGGGIAAWTMVTVVRAAGTWKYYINGSLDTANAGTATPNAIDGTCTCGIANATGHGDQRFAYVSYYTSALSATQVAAHWSAAEA